MHTITSLLQEPWLQAAAYAAMLLGIVNVWRGLLGGLGSKGALLPRGIGMLERMEGFRLMVFGLVVLGVGAAVIWRLEWLFYLSLGIGFVEILESSTLIAVWRRAEGDVG